MAGLVEKEKALATARILEWAGVAPTAVQANPAAAKPLATFDAKLDKRDAELRHALRPLGGRGHTGTAQPTSRGPAQPDVEGRGRRAVGPGIHGLRHLELRFLGPASVEAVSRTRPPSRAYTQSPTTVRCPPPPPGSPGCGG
ncbi:hypothetical protein SALBM217S_10237 [Streptomyces griseoloalbus]